MICYSNDGLSFRAVEDDYKEATGEVLFADYAAPQQLEAAFPKYASATIEQQLFQIGSCVASHVEEQARARGYDSGPACASYLGSKVPSWAKDAEAFVSWRDDVWQRALADQDAIRSGQMTAPEDVQKYIAAFPTLTWPA